MSGEIPRVPSHLEVLYGFIDSIPEHQIKSDRETHELIQAAEAFQAALHKKRIEITFKIAVAAVIATSIVGTGQYLLNFIQNSTQEGWDAQHSYDVLLALLSNLVAAGFINLANEIKNDMLYQSRPAKTYHQEVRQRWLEARSRFPHLLIRDRQPDASETAYIVKKIKQREKPPRAPYRPNIRSPH